MGYLVTAHVVKSAPDLARLEALPKSIAWAVYHENDAGAWYVDTFAAGKKHEWPFTSVPSFKDVPVDLPESLGQLSRVYAALKKARLADGFIRPFLNLNLLLSKTLGLPVLSFCSDDEGVDFACLSQDGALQRLRCECGDIAVTFQDGKVEIQPLRIEDDDLELTDLTDLHDPASGISVMERNKDHSTLLHLIAGEEVSAFLGISKPPLGLRSFEGNEKPPTKVASSAQASANAQPRQETKPWWKFWVSGIAQQRAPGDGLASRASADVSRQKDVSRTFPPDIDTWLRSNLIATELAYLASARSSTIKDLAAIGISESTELAHLYINYGPGSVRGWYELDEVDTIAEATEYAHSELGVPDHFLALTGTEGQGILLYDTKNGSIFDVEFGQFEHLADGKLVPLASSVVGYLRWCMEQSVPPNKSP